MMDDEGGKMKTSYDELLDKAFEKLPKREETKDRFVVPEVVLEVSGSRTVLKNFSEISDRLRRDNIDLEKFLSKESATGGSIHGGTLVFQGNIRREILQKKLDDYIKEFVYCRECKEPDTRLVKEGRVTFMVCEACGAKHPMRNI